jgi:hypothetical protein
MKLHPVPSSTGVSCSRGPLAEHADPEARQVLCQCSLFLVKAASNRSEGSKWDFRNYILLINKELLEDKAEQPIWSRPATKNLVTFWMVASLSN